MHSLLFEIPTPWFTIPIRSYGVMAAVGFLFALAMLLRLAGRSHFKRELAYDLWFAAFIGGFVGARIWYVIQYWGEQFAGNPARVLAITSGGLVWFGGIIGGLAGVCVAIRKHKAAVLPVLDLLTPATALGLGFGRIGCFLNGCCFGRVTSLPWAVSFPEGSPAFLHHLRKGLVGPGDEWSLPVHPTQIYASLYAFALAAAMYAFYLRRKSPGRLFALYLLLYALMRIFFEWLRDDVEPWILGMTPAQVAGTAVIIFAIALYLRATSEKMSTKTG